MVQSLRDSGKVILKLLFLALALSFIFSRVFHREHFLELREMLSSGFLKTNSLLLITQLLLLFFNIGLESMKWKYIMKDIHHMSFMGSVRGILSGIAAGMFTPNRAGEFIGRIIQLPEGKRVKGTLASVVLSVIQLFCTISFGIAGLLYLDGKYVITNRLLSSRIVLWSALILISASTILVLIYRSEIFRKSRALYDTISAFRKSSLLMLAFLSACRYIVFTIQFSLALVMFGVQLSMPVMFTGIGLFFLLTTIIPSFLFTEILTRGATAVMIFAAFQVSEFPVFMASTFIWCLNIVLPSLAGSVIIIFKR